MIIEEKDLKPNELPVNRIVHGDALSVLKKFPSESVDCVITSPPNKVVAGKPSLCRAGIRKGRWVGKL